MDSAGYIIAIAAYVLMALSQLVDKAFLSTSFKDSRAFSAFIGLMHVLVLAMLPLGLVSLPSDWFTGFVALAVGASFVLALLPFLSALQGDDASRVIPVVGSLLPIGVLILERVFYGTLLQKNQYAAFALLVAGALVMTISHKQGRRSFSALGKAVLAAFLFALSFAASKYVYDRLGFFPSFFWMRLGGLLVGLALLLSASIRSELMRFFGQRKRVVAGYFGNQMLGGIGFVLQNYAISVSGASLVSALQGVQYVFILFFAVMASVFYPRFIKEEISASIVAEKTVAVLMTAAGLVVLFLWSS